VGMLAGCLSYVWWGCGGYSFMNFNRKKGYNGVILSCVQTQIKMNFMSEKNQPPKNQSTIKNKKTKPANPQSKNQETKK
jgi:hypothetical protein